MRDSQLSGSAFLDCAVPGASATIQTADTESPADAMVAGFRGVEGATETATGSKAPRALLY